MQDFFSKIRADKIILLGISILTATYGLWYEATSILYRSSIDYIETTYVLCIKT